MGNVGINGRDQFWNACEYAAPQLLGRNVTEESFNHVQPRRRDTVSVVRYNSAMDKPRPIAQRKPLTGAEIAERVRQFVPKPSRGVRYIPTLKRPPK